MYQTRKSTMRTTYRVIQPFLSFKKGEELYTKYCGNDIWYCKTSPITEKAFYFIVRKKSQRKEHGRIHAIRCIPEKMINGYKKNIERI